MSGHDVSRIHQLEESVGSLRYQLLQALEYNAILRDAYDRQCQLTREALLESRSSFDKMWKYKTEWQSLHDECNYWYALHQRRQYPVPFTG